MLILLLLLMLKAVHRAGCMLGQACAEGIAIVQLFKHTERRTPHGHSFRRTVSRHRVMSWRRRRAAVSHRHHGLHSSVETAV